MKIEKCLEIISYLFKLLLFNKFSFFHSFNFIYHFFVPSCLRGKYFYKEISHRYDERFGLSFSPAKMVPSLAIDIS